MYLDNSTKPKPSMRAVERALIYVSEHYGSIASPHQMGDQLVQDANVYKEQIAQFFNARESDRFVFTSSGHEAVSQVFHSVKKGVVEKEGKNHIIARVIDEACVMYALQALEADACMVTFAPVSSHGYMTLEAMQEGILEKTALISCSLSSALTGVIQPVEALIEYAKAHNILFHLDVTHCIGKITLDFQELDCDYISFNGAQCHALEGTGGLFAKKEAPLYPLIHGEFEETLYRGAPVNMPLFASLAQALEEATSDEMHYCTEVSRLRDMLESELSCHCPGATVLFQNEERLPHISAISFEGVKAEALAYALNRKNVYACMGGGAFQNIQHVLQASGMPSLVSQSALSFSLSKYTQEAEITEACSKICDAVKRLQKTSKVYFSHESA